jgi:endoglucanase
MPSKLLKAILPVALLGSATAAAFFLPADPSRGAPDAATRPTLLPMRGINLASGEFAPDQIPGIYNKDYKYPGERAAAPFVAMGMNTVRVPVLWERLQPNPLAPLDEKEMARIDQMIARLGGFSTIIIDLHNYGRYRGVVLDRGTGAQVLSDFWSRMARRYGNSRSVAFGIMNEPFDIGAHDWRHIADKVVQSVRSTGARNLLLIPGTRWTGAHSWTSGGSNSNAAAMRGFKDPANNFLFEVHQYLDHNSSGKSKTCAGAGVGSQRLQAFTRWLREQRAKAILAEFGASSDPTCVAALSDILSYMSRNADVWSGWTYWAGGDWWGSYAYNVQPKQGAPETPQLSVLRRYLQMR